VPFFTGCYSKDHILELAASQFTILAGFVFWGSSLTAFFTAAYSTRLIYLAMASTPNGHHFFIVGGKSRINHGSWTLHSSIRSHSARCVGFASSRLLGFGLVENCY
jgi:NADH:ubiquinone oxidoreductase subunit 5 (subunit L)/multisubunit Na+/H+ antiporter MnhA subunit